MELDLLKIEELLMDYISLIGKEYPNSRTHDILEKIKNGHKIVEFNSSSSISFLVNNDKLLLPKYVYTIFSSLENDEIVETLAEYDARIQQTEKGTTK